jgi:multiple sugar transport system permease protein
VTAATRPAGSAGSAGLATGPAGRSGPGPGRGGRPPGKGGGLLPTAALLVGAVYCLLPVLWVLIAATKNRSELFSTFSYAPSFSGGFTENLRGLFDYGDGRFVRWARNSVLYAGVGAALSTMVSAAAGYGLAKYRFRGRSLAFNVLLAGVLLPQITLAIPQYLLMSKVGMAGTYWSVLLPSIIYPYGIYLCRIYAAAAVPDDMIEAGRIDGAGEGRIFRSIAVPVMLPGLVTVFLLQFVAIWNNFLLPFIMLSNEDRYPLTVGLFTMVNQGVQQPGLYTLVITGSLLSILPLIALFLFLQRYWRMDLLSGAVKH